MMVGNNMNKYTVKFKKLKLGYYVYSIANELFYCPLKKYRKVSIS